MATTTETNLITLPTKPTAQLSYTFHPPSGLSSNKTLIVFLNGLTAPQTSWIPIIHHLQFNHPHNLPAILTYDRYGQGQTLSRDPTDQNATDPSHGHDILSALDDLHQLIQQIARLHLHKSTAPSDLNLILVGNSLGCALARLYAQTYPGTVSALLLLDSILANSDFVSVIPDPTAPDFVPPQGEDGISAQDLIMARAIAGKVFHPSVGSKEGLSRRNLAELLPKSDGPRLMGPDAGRGPWVTVIGHDGKAFAEESVRMTGGKVSGRVFEVYVTPFWERYHRGLLGITDEERGRGPLVAEGAGHVVQLGNPGFVAEELRQLLDKVMA
ncbi:alpha/beta hydrolase [Aspergillus vadensis CBS 113365]|uniref:Alpha/beta-hydrolase n=1 Tax=Aspergillus vadensis (strain CBS 113365 / IMI 142717 / IBT 24658) TaxID=1448311 RepID=A0A319C4Z3_ASPVC|nr:alpha/beta-hydrolase [Aspergillus vadensis CBS 113365]PYH63852.1 alpha/beta-hydrolase [Aspergillus vadensis CBS 113365]